jgi:hypothetical protein
MAKSKMPKGKDFGMTIGGMTSPKTPKKHMMTKGAKAKMMKKSAPKR